MLEPHWLCLWGVRVLCELVRVDGQRLQVRGRVLNFISYSSVWPLLRQSGGVNFYQVLLY